MSINIAICDVNPYHLNELLAEVMKFCKSIDIKPSISTYRNPAQLLKDFLKTDFQILITNTRIGKVSGIDLAKRVNILYPKTRVIFVTELENYTTDVYTVRHIYTVLKSDLSQLSKALNRFFFTPENAASTLTISFKGKRSVLPFKNIIYIEKSLRKALFYTTQGNYKTYRSTDDILTVLPKNMFVQCHRAFIVNLLYIKDINSTELNLYNGHLIPVGRNYLSLVKESIEVLDHVSI